MCYESGFPDRFYHIQMAALDIFFKADSIDDHDNSEEFESITLVDMWKGPFIVLIYLSILVIFILLVELYINSKYSRLHCYSIGTLNKLVIQWGRLELFVT